MATAPFFGNPAVNAPGWSRYAVLFGGLGATVPVGNAAFTLNDPAAGTPVTGQWDPVGALDSDNPMDDGAETITTEDHTAAGFGVYGQTFKDQKEVRTFTAKESTLVTLGILYDPSALTVTSGNISGVLKQRDPTRKFLIAFHRENATQMERYISKLWATIESITRNAGNNETTYTVGALIAPDATTTPAGLYNFYLGAK